jgi:hypothetical protein
VNSWNNGADSATGGLAYIGNDEFLFLNNLDDTLNKYKLGDASSTVVYNFGFDFGNMGADLHNGVRYTSLALGAGLAALAARRRQKA